MSEANFSVRTQADLSGLRAMSSMLDDIARKSKMIAEAWAGARFPGTAQSAVAAGGGTVSPANTGTPQRRMQRAGQTAGQQYNLNTPQGLYQWYENVYEPEAGVLAQMAQGFGQKLGYGSPVRARRSAPMSTTVPVTRAALMSQRSINSWFAGLSSQTASMSSEARNAYVQTAFSENQNSAIKDFYTQYGAQLGAPTGARPAGGAGGGGGSGSGGFGSEFGMALGGAAKQYLPWLSVGASVAHTAGQLKQGYGLWQSSSAPVDQLAHSLGSAAQNVEAFRQSITSAGAAFGVSVQQSTQAALSFAQVFGNLGQTGFANLVGQTAQWGQQNGVPFQQASQITSTSGLLGITSGTGLSMSTSQFQNMLSNMSRMGGVPTKQGEMGTAYLSLANQVGSMNPVISNPQIMAGTLAAMSKTGLQAFQGMRGEQVAGQLYSGFMNAAQNPYAQGTIYASIYKATGGKINNPIQMLALAQSGPQTTLPGTHTTLGQAYLNLIRSQTSNPLMQAQLLVGSGMANSIPEAEQLLKTHGLFSTTVSTNNNTPFWLSTYDYLKNSQAYMQTTQANAGGAFAPIATIANNLGMGGQSILSLYGSYALGKYGLRGVGAFAGRGAGFATMVGDNPSVLSRIGSGLGSVWSRFGGAIKGAGLDVLGGAEEVGGAALDATGVGAVGGVPLNVLGAGTIALGTGMLAKNIYNQSAAAHVQTVTMHTAQVRQQAAQRISSNMSLKSVTIDQLKISNITLPSSMKSLMSSSVNAGSTYAPTSGTNSGGGLWGSFTNWVGNLFGGGNVTGGNSAAQTGYVTSGPSGVKPWMSTINAASKQYGVPASILAGIMQVESGGNQNGPNGKILTSSAGALGIMQFEPGTASSLGVNVNDPTSEIYGAAKYLKQLYGQTGNSWNNAIMGYNGGVGGVGTLATEHYLQQVLAAEKTVKLSADSINALGQLMKQINGYSAFHLGLGPVRP